MAFPFQVFYNLFRNAVYLRVVSCRLTAMPKAFFVPTRTPRGVIAVLLNQ
jgi:hypothetical protein